MEFLIPVDSNGEYIHMYRVLADNIDFRTGSIVINEDKSVTESFTKEKNHSGYKHHELKEILKVSKLI